ncbi:hypothetical protein GOODEAATRI_014531 [Goodea atripinnis]|uniref:Uncharacterized protein n=1 Tax=Goodea atripinnis TaxID=208336 RepID=A0ABV0NCX8_9TELE
MSSTSLLNTPQQAISLVRGPSILDHIPIFRKGKQIHGQPQCLKDAFKVNNLGYIGKHYFKVKYIGNIKVKYPRVSRSCHGLNKVIENLMPAVHKQFQTVKKNCVFRFVNSKNSCCH